MGGKGTSSSCTEISLIIPFCFEIAGLFSIVANAYCCYLIKRSVTFSDAVKTLMWAQCGHNLIQAFFYTFYFGPIIAFPNGLADYARLPYFRMGVTFWLDSSFFIQALMAIHRFITFHQSAKAAEKVFSKYTRCFCIGLIITMNLLNKVRTVVTAVIMDGDPGFFDPCQFKWSGNKGKAYRKYKWLGKLMGPNSRIVCLAIILICYFYVAIKIIINRKKLTSDAAAMKHRKLEIRLSAQFATLAGIQGLQIILSNVAKVVGARGIAKVVFYEAVKYVLCVMDPLMYIMFSQELRRMFLTHIGLDRKKADKVSPISIKIPSIMSHTTKSTRQ